MRRITGRLDQDQTHTNLLERGFAQSKHLRSHADQKSCHSLGAGINSTSSQHVVPSRLSRVSNPRLQFRSPCNNHNLQRTNHRHEVHPSGVPQDLQLSSHHQRTQPKARIRPPEVQRTRRRCSPLQGSDDRPKNDLKPGCKCLQTQLLH